MQHSASWVETSGFCRKLSGFVCNSVLLEFCLASNVLDTFAVTSQDTLRHIMGLAIVFLS